MPASAKPDDWEIRKKHKTKKEKTTIWLNYNDLRTTSLEDWFVQVNESNYPKIALLQIREWLQLTQNHHYTSWNYYLLMVKHGLNYCFIAFWLVVWNMNFMTFHILGMSSPQVINSYIFQRGRFNTNQPPTSFKTFNCQVAPIQL